MALTTSIVVDPVSGLLVKEIKKDQYNIIRRGLTKAEETEHYARLDAARKNTRVPATEKTGEDTTPPDTSTSKDVQKTASKGPARKRTPMTASAD